MTGIYPAGHMTDDELLLLAYSLERKSEHPLARAVVEKAEERGMSPKETSGFRAFAGNGLAAVMDGDTIHGGSETVYFHAGGYTAGYDRTLRALGEKEKRRFSLNGTGSSWGL